MSIILHITRWPIWQQALESGSYEVGSLSDERYIHCSKPEQVISVANHLFHSQENLVLLGIDTDKLASEIRYENCESDDELFPHIYGPLNLDAVTRVCEFRPLPDGTFALPEGLVDTAG